MAEEDSEALSSVSSVEDGGQCREAGEDNEEDTSSDREAYRQESRIEWLKRTAGSLDFEIKKGAVSDWVVEQRRRKWRWAGHIVRMKGLRWTVRMLHWIPVGGERSRGRPATRWEDELKEFAKSLGKKWEDCAADRGLWGSLEASFVEFGVA